MITQPPPSDATSPAPHQIPIWAMTELSPEVRERLLDSGARWVVAKGLQTPAVMFLEMHKPLTTMAAVSYAFFQPPLLLFFGFRRTEETRLLLSDRENIEELIRRIERFSSAPKPATLPSAQKAREGTPR